jgi:Ca-activated chloride channel homolog
LAFHFIRPLWLLVLIPTLGIVTLLVRRSDRRRVWSGLVDSHLLPHLMTQSDSNREPRPHLLLGLILILICFAMAGPAWILEPAPFADDTAALVIAVEVTSTMLAQDIQPSRLARAALKIEGLLERRKGSPTALVAYAGSAHLVMPLTEDGALIASFASELTPKIMPVDGDAADAAIALAQAHLISSGKPGSVLLITDGVSEATRTKIADYQSGNMPRVHVYGIAAGAEAIFPPDSPPAPPLDRRNLEKAADAGRGSLVLYTPDGKDVERLARIVETQFTELSNPSGGNRWKDFGYWLMPLIGLLTLWWFRPGWTIQWQRAGLFLLIVLIAGNSAHLSAQSGSEDGKSGKPGKPPYRSWFITADQKAQRLYNAKQFSAAAELFTDPFRKGVAYYRAGEFKLAATEFGRSGTAEGFFCRGNALVFQGRYDEAINSFEQALRAKPNWDSALTNLAVAKARLATLAPPDDAVSQKAMGEDDEPDEIVFDDRAANQEDANTEVISGAGEELSDATLRAMWLRRVETSPADFMRWKFAYQYHRTGETEGAVPK